MQKPFRYLGIVFGISAASLISTARAQTTASAVTDLEFKFQFNFLGTAPSLLLKIFPSAISGQLDGAGDHFEQWGIHQRGIGDDGFFEADGPIDPFLVPTWGPAYGTQAYTSDGSFFRMLLYTEARSASPPNSFAWAETSPEAQTIATAFNSTEVPVPLSFTIGYEVLADAVASAAPGGQAFAEANWDFSLSAIRAGGLIESLLFNRGHQQVSSDLPPSPRENIFRISAEFNTVTNEAIYSMTLAPNETVQFNLDQATVSSRAVTSVPEPGTYGMFAAIALFLAASCRSRWNRRGESSKSD